MAIIHNDKSNTLLSGTSNNDSIQNGGYWVDSGNSYGSYHFAGSEVTINGGDGDDTIYNNIYGYRAGASVSINAGAGNDFIYNHGDKATVGGGTGNDTIENYGWNVTINGGAGNDKIYNYVEKVTISGDNGADAIENRGSEVTISGGTGSDTIFNACGLYSDGSIYYLGYQWDFGKNVLFKYSSGDGNDVIYGFKEDSTLSIDGSYSTTKSSNDIIVTVGTGKISLMGAATLNTLNIKGTKKSTGATTTNIFSNVNVTDLGGESKESIRNKAISGLSSLLKTDMSDVVLKNVDGLKTLDDQTRKKLSSLASIFKLANEANSSFGVLGNLCASAETFLGLIQSKKRDANWGKQVSDCVKNLLKFGNAILKLSDKELAKSLGLGLGGSIFGLVGSIVATTDGITNDERDNIVKDVFSVSGEFAKLIMPTAKAPSMEIDLVVAVASALYMGDVQMQKSLEQAPANGVLYLMPNFVSAKIDSVTVSLDEFARKMTKGVSDIFLNWLDEKTSGNTYSNMTYTQKASEGLKILFNRLLIGNITLANNISNAIGNWWTKVTSSLNQKGLNLKGDGKNNILLGSTKKDTLSGGAGNDKLYGQDGNDSLVGGDGADTLSGGKGTDTLTGGTGNDLFVYSAGKDVITDYAAGDKIKISSGKISKSTLSGSDVVFTVGTGSLTVKNAKGKSLAMIDSAGKSFSTILGGATTSTLMTVTNSTKSPVTIGSAIKTVNASKRTTAIKITGNTLANTISGGTKNDSLYGGTGDDSILGNAGNDKIYGEVGNDKLYGGAGNDELTGGKGNDSLWGDAGKDTFFYSNGDGKDVIFGFETGDLLQITGTFSGTYNSSKKEIYFKVGTTANALTLKDFSATSFKINGTNYGISGTKIVKK